MTAMRRTGAVLVAMMVLAGCGTSSMVGAPLAPSTVVTPAGQPDTTAEGFFDPDPAWAQTQIAAEMKRLGVKFRPKVVIDWTSYVDDNSQTIHLSRFKFSKTFRALAQRCMYDTTFIHLLRHETSHAFFNKKWHTGMEQAYMDAFGDVNTPYHVSVIDQALAAIRFKDRPEFVSKYAQLHPAEDFAETMAVYLQKSGDPAKIDKYLKANNKNLGLKRKFDYVALFFKALQVKFPGEPKPAPVAGDTP
jgi:hypothetical protein